MTWLGQAWHVFLKDLRQQRWLVVAYVIVVVLAVGHAWRWPLLRGDSFGAMSALIGLLGTLAIAVMVQQDSPTRTDAFWAAHPLHPTAVLGAKVLSVLLLLGVALTGQLIALRSYALAGEALWRSTMLPTVFFCCMLVLSMLLAALVRDLRSFVLVVVAIPVVIGLSVALLRLSSEQLRHVLAWPAALGAVVAIGMLPWLYFARDGRARTRWLGFAAIAAVLAGTVQRGDPSRTAPLGTLGTIRVPIALESAGIDDGRLSVLVRSGTAPEGTHVQLRGISMHATLSDAGELYLPTSYGQADFGGYDEGAPPRGLGVRWIPRMPVGQAHSTVSAPLTASQRSDVLERATRVTLDAQAVILETRVLAELPLRVGLDTTTSGQRIGIKEWRPVASDGAIVVRVQGVPDSRYASTSAGSKLRFALLNPRRREAVRFGGYSASGGVEGLVIPGTPFESYTMTLRLPRQESGGGDPRNAADLLPGDEWYRDARLLVLTEVPVSAYVVRVTRAGGVRNGPPVIDTRSQQFAPLATAR